MKKLFASILATRRRYKAFRKQNKTYKVLRYSLTCVMAAYGLILLFPQFLFANHIGHKNFDVYARQSLDQEIIKVLDAAEAKLIKSPIYDSNSNQRIFIADSHGFHKFLTLKSFAFASTIPVIGHIRINKSDISEDRVFRDSTAPNSRSLSGVIAHEITHNQIREKLGIAANFRIPTWKDEGYCEYVAGETTLSFEEGVRLWRETPADDAEYDYFKYHQMVKYLLEVEKVSVDELLTQEFDERELESTVFARVIQP